MDLTLDVIVESDIGPGAQVDELERLVPFVLNDSGASGHWTVVVVLTDDARLRELHRRFMGIDSETDVMTFPLGGDAADARGGEIVVSVERAAAQAVDYDHSVAEEVRFLVMHGLLHLCDWNDQTDEERSKMWAEQRRVLDAFDRLVAEAENGSTAR